MLYLKIPDLDTVITEANKKGLNAKKIADGTGLSTQTTYAYFNGERVSNRTLELIVNYINNYEK